MNFRVKAAAAVAAALFTLAGHAADPLAQRAVVIVSGGGATSPFTTPTAACKKGFAGGATDDALRTALLKSGYQVFTSPAQAGPGAIAADQSPYGFDECPSALPASMTVNSVGGIDEAGVHLAAYFEHLRTAYGVTTVDIVGHSMGGLFSRSALKLLKAANSPLKIRSLTTIGTPWEGAFPADYTTGGNVSLSDCNGDAVCEASLKEFKEFWLPHSTGAGQQVTRAYLAGPDGWNERQGSVLNGIPVTLIGGDYFKNSWTKSEVWPHDNLVSLRSALATNVSDGVLPHRTCLTVPDVHSIYFADQRKIDRTSGITFDPKTIVAVKAAIEGAPLALTQPNRIGCPAPL